MAYINIPGSQSIGDSLSSINTNALNFDTRITSLEFNRTSITNTLNTVSTEVFNTNSVVQIVSNTETIAAVKSTGTNASYTYQNPTATPITSLTLIRTTNTSKILIELTGGVTNLLSDRFLYTYFYISLNGDQPLNRIGNPVEVKFRSGGGAVREPHYAKAVYVPSNALVAGTTISVQVWAKLTARDNWWHDPTISQVPFTFTLTEIL